MHFRFLHTGSNEEELRDYFDGRTSDDSVLRRHNMNIQVVRDQEVIRRGVVQIHGYPS